jgi:hypothetical protein
MKKARRAAKTASPKPSIERLKEMPLDEYTKLLARNMADTLSAKTKRGGVKGQPKTGKRD